LKKTGILQGEEHSMTIRSRTLRPAALLPLLLLTAWMMGGDASAAERPNILLILGDDVGVEVLGCYGGTSYSTPRLDELAAGGMRFEHGYVMPVCHPTRTTMLTGRYPFRLGNPTWGTFPESEEGRTFAHRLKDAGYATAIAGKWQLTMLGQDTHHPQRLGFDESCLFGWHEGPRYYDPLIYQNGAVRGDTQGRYGPDIYTEFLIDFIQRHRERPFLAYYSMALCHDVTDDLDHFVPFGPGKDRYDSYSEMVEQMDEHVGCLIDALDRFGLRENTLILYVGDNGTPKASIAGVRNGKLYRDPVVSRIGDREVPGGKGELTDGGTHVPLIANWPGTVNAGTVVDDLVDVSDFYATTCDLAGATTGDVPIDGVSFAPVLFGRPGKRQWAYAEGGRSYWVRTQRWKLYNDGRLFDLADGSDENAPIAAAAQSAEAAAARRELEEALHSIRAD
jgi:arylsulfatase A